MKLPLANTVPYFKTSKTPADQWIDRAMAEIKKVKGIIEGHAFGSETGSGRAAYMIAFRLGDDHFRLTWPVLPSRSGEERAAQTQAATLLFHDVKAMCVKAAVFGVRSAFFQHLLLPDGREAHQAATPELLEHLPAIAGAPRLTDNRPQ